MPKFILKKNFSEQKVEQEFGKKIDLNNPPYASKINCLYADALKKLFHKLIPPEPTGRPGRPRNPEKLVDEDLD